jgi:TRAP-type uncharacterized transport system substrate-binding protein
MRGRRPLRDTDETLNARAIARVRLLAIAGTMLLALAAPARFDATQAQVQPSAEQRALIQQQALRTKLNDSTLLVATSHPSATYFGMASDMAAVVSGTDGIRILPVASNGGALTLRDLLFLRGIDMAIVPSNVLMHAKANEALGGGLTQRLAFVTRLYSEEVHLLVGRSVGSIEDLRGKQIAVPADDGTAQFTAQDLLGRLQLGAELVTASPADAIEKVRAGSLAAAVLVGGKPMPQLLRLARDGSVRLLDLSFARSQDDAYSPAVFVADDYPALVPPGQMVETLAVSPVLLTNSGKGNEEAARRVARVIPVLFGGLSGLALADRHPKWRDVNLAATLPGWSRFAAAEQWLAKAREQQAGSLQKRFEDFLRATRRPGAPDLPAAERKKLFDEFVGWTRKSLGDAGQSVRQ